MDSISGDLLVGVAGNAITSLLSRAGRRFLRSPQGMIPTPTSASDPPIVAILEEVASEFYDRHPSYPLPGPDGAVRYLSSTEAQIVARQLLVERYLSNAHESTVAILQDNLINGLALYTGETTDRIRATAIEIFKDLQTITDRILVHAIEHGILAAHEMRNIARHQSVMSELASVQQSIQLLQTTKIDVEDVFHFASQYRSQIAHKTDHIIAPSIDNVRRLPLDAIYVTPSLIQSRRTNDGFLHGRIAIDSFLHNLGRAVILGTPGGGKSTLARKIAHDVASSSSDSRSVRAPSVPILVNLRDYGAEKKRQRTSLIHYIESEGRTDLQLQVPSGAIEYLLLSGYGMVIFDGLDELLDTSYRQQISSDIELFCNNYSSTPTIVTSRAVGYEQAPLDSRRFRTYQLAPFDEGQIEQYVTKWFQSEPQIGNVQHSARVQSFMTESRVVPDLRSNPLMLTLICSIYRGENYIPRNRPEVYRKCSLMLFEKWDQSRDIRVQLPFETQVRPAMMHLAYKIYSDPAMQSGVTESGLINEVTSYLHAWQFEDVDEAERSARLFVEFCRGRAWVFTEVGLTPQNEGLYHFTHRTFLEYFAAAYLDRTHGTPRSLLEVLLPRIVEREWDVVAQLAFQIQSERLAGAGDELLRALLEESSHADDEHQWNILSFAVRSLGFVVPTPATRRSVVRASFDHVLSRNPRVRSRMASLHAESPAYGDYDPASPAVVDYELQADSNTALVADLLRAASENRESVADEIQQIAMAKIRSQNIETSKCMAELVSFLPGVLSVGDVQARTSASESDYWIGFADRFFEQCRAKYESLASDYVSIAYELMNRGLLTVEEFLDKYRLIDMFTVYTSDRFPTVADLPPSISALLSLTDDRSRLVPPVPTAIAEHHLASIGAVLLNRRTPWLIRGDVRLRYFTNMVIDFAFRPLPPGSDVVTHSSDVRFGIFSLLAIAIENSASRHREDILLALERQGATGLSAITAAVAARYLPRYARGIDATLDSCRFSTEQTRFVRRWAERRIYVVSSAKQVAKAGN